MLNLLLTILLAFTSLSSRALEVRSFSGKADIVPGAVAVATGIRWADRATQTLNPFLPPFELAGYSIDVDFHPARISYVDAERIVFWVPQMVKPGVRIVRVTGPAATYTIPASVIAYDPEIVLRRPLGDEDSRCCAQGLYATFGPPWYFNGNPVVTNEAGFVQVVAFVSGLGDPYDARPTVHLKRLRQSFKVSGVAFSRGSGLATEVVSFIPPRCVSGEFEMRLQVGDKVSEPALIRINSPCTERRASVVSPR